MGKSEALSELVLRRAALSRPTSPMDNSLFRQAASHSAIEMHLRLKRQNLVSHYVRASAQMVLDSWVCIVFISLQFAIRKFALNQTICLHGLGSPCSHGALPKIRKKKLLKNLRSSLESFYNSSCKRLVGRK